VARFSMSQVPQADRTELLFRIVDAVNAGAKTDIEIAAALGGAHVDRQGRYYRKAAESLDLLNPVHQNISTLTMRGKEIADSDQHAVRMKLMIDGAMASPVLRALVQDLHSERKDNVTSNEIRNWLLANTDLSPSTAGRRASSVRNYLTDLGLLTIESARSTPLGHTPTSLVVDTVLDDELSLKELASRSWSVLDPLPPPASSETQNDHMIVSLRSKAQMEQTNAKHEELVRRVAERARQAGFRCLRNSFVDLYVNNGDAGVLFEMKTNTTSNTISQVRKGVSQLYEYEYQQKLKDTPLSLVLQEEPKGASAWVTRYLVESRSILPVWTEGESFTGHERSREALDWLIEGNG
jgi:hypothetical protein